MREFHELPGPLWLIGCGNMAGAMLRRWLEVGMDAARVTVVRPSGAAVAPGVKVLTVPPTNEPPAIAMLGVKPQQLDEVAPGVADAIGSETLLISILAGVEQTSLHQRFPAVPDIVRAMPNMPVAIGKGAIGLFADQIDPGARDTASALMAPLGVVEWIEDEGLFDVLAALTASGPAFVFRFIDALAASAAALGLPQAQAQRLALATVEGAGALAAGAEESPHALAQRVASPGGMTRQGLNMLDEADALRSLVQRALEAAVRRSRAMGEDARAGR